VLNAARVLRAQVGPGEALPADLRPVLRQLYSAIAAVDAVGEVATAAEPAPDSPGSHQNAICGAPGVKTELGAASSPVDRPGFCQADPDCWRTPDTADGTCFAHSPLAAAPQVRRRDRLFAGGEDG
jgi:hypothetical protein